jgi:hypothetical protein
MSTIINIGQEVTFNLFDKTYDVTIMTINPIKQIELIPTTIEEKQKELEAIDPDKNRDEYIAKAKELQGIVDNVNEKKLKLMVYGNSSDELIHDAKNAGVLDVLVSKIEEELKKK